MNITLSQHMVLSRYFHRKWRNNWKLKVNKTVLQLKLLVFLIGCMSQHCLILSRILAFLSRMRLRRYRAFGRRMLGIESFSKLGRNLFIMLSWQSPPFLTVSWKLTGRYLTCNRIAQFRAESPKIEPGRKRISISNNKLSARQPQRSIRTSSQEKWPTSSEKCKTKCTTNATWNKFKNKTRWNSDNK